MARIIRIMDTTLRDGLQTEGVRMTPGGKLQVAAALLAAGVDHVEVASAGVPGEMEAVRAIVQMAAEHDRLDSIEVLGFVDGRKSVDWARATGVRTLNLLVKGSRRHCLKQLRVSPRRHQLMIGETVRYAREQGVRINVYLEDWSQGIKNSPAYVESLVRFLARLPIGRLMLCDTLGVLYPGDTRRFVRQTSDWSGAKELDTHCHNDYGLAVANTLAAVEVGATGVHVAVNGLGERAGNAPLDEVVVGIHDHLGEHTSVRENRLTGLSRLVASLSGRRLHPNKPVAGSVVFANTAGVHADGDLKGGLYVSQLHPKRFGRRTEHTLGALGGVASVRSNLQSLGLELAPPHIQRIVSRVHQLSTSSHHVTQADLLYLVADELEQPELVSFQLLDGFETSSTEGAGSIFSGCVRYRGEEFNLQGEGVGPLDAFLEAVRSLVDVGKLTIRIPEVVDYDAYIPPGGGSDALVEAVVEWRTANHATITTSGLSRNSAHAPIRAAEKALNLLNRNGA